MAVDAAIAALTSMTVMAAPDEFVIVDKSDTFMGASGTTKRLPVSVMLADPVFLAALDARYAPIAASAATAWTALTLTNSWVAYAANYTPQYRKVGDNVQIRGLMKDGANASPFTLPAGFRPAYPEETFAVFATNAIGGISIANNGAAAIQSPTATGAGKYIYLSGIIFSTVA